VTPHHVLEHLRGRLVRVERAGDRLDRAGRDLVALGDQVGELVHHRSCSVDCVRLAIERQAISSQI
jgi:hypothetical protein